jgi:hypothetical protein
MEPDKERKKRMIDEDEDINDTRQFYDRGWFWGFLAIIAGFYFWYKYLI